MGFIDISRSKRSPGVQRNKSVEQFRAISSFGLAFDRVHLSRGGRRIFDALSLDLREQRVGLVGDTGRARARSCASPTACCCRNEAR
jgi:hypothetical protein